MPPFRKPFVLLTVSIVGVGALLWRLEDGLHRARLSEPLLAAVQREEVATVRNLLEQGADPDARLEETPGTHSLLAYLRERFAVRRRQARANAPTALLLAAQYDREPTIALLLLDHGAHVDRPGDFGTLWMERTSYGTPLIAAACNRHPETVRLLLQRGANPNQTSQTKQTALMFAAVKGEVGMAQALLARGANPNARDVHGNFPLVDAADWNLRYENYPPLYTENGQTHLTPEAAHLTVIRRLLEARSDPNAHYADGGNALADAAYGKHPDIVRLLLEKGTDPKAADKDGWMPLHFACEAHEDWDYRIPVSRKLETLRLLLDAGVDINAPTKTGQTPLLLAQEAQQPAVIRLLQSRGARDINRSNQRRGAVRADSDISPLSQKMPSGGPGQ